MDSTEHDREMAEPEVYTMLSGEAVILRLLGPSKHIKPIQIELLNMLLSAAPGYLWPLKEYVVKSTLCAVIYLQLIERFI